MGIFKKAVVLSEALFAQHHVELAPEPEGPHHGVAAGHGALPATAERPALRVVALGDSMVAGCGVDSTLHSLVPDLASALANDIERPIEWSLDGKLGATMRRVRYRMLPAVAEGGTPIDILLICAGSNDIMARRSPADWKDDLTAVVRTATTLARHVVVLSSGQLYKSPSLGHALRKEVERRIDAQTADSAEICEKYGAIYVDLTHDQLHADSADFWASDHFHPSALGYVLIAEATAGKLHKPLLKALVD